MQRSCFLVGLAALALACGPRRGPAETGAPAMTMAVGTATQAPATSSSPASATATVEPALANARIYHGEAPDDGPAYIVAIGPRSPVPDAFGGTCHVDHSKTGFEMGLPYKAIPIPAVGPVTFTVGAADDKTEGRVCTVGRACSALSAGTVEVLELQPGRMARGSYALSADDGRPEVKGTFVATWCGDPPRPTDRVVAAPATSK